MRDEERGGRRGRKEREGREEGRRKEENKIKTKALPAENESCNTHTGNC